MDTKPLVIGLDQSKSLAQKLDQDKDLKANKLALVIYKPSNLALIVYVKPQLSLTRTIIDLLTNPKDFTKQDSLNPSYKLLLYIEYKLSF